MKSRGGFSSLERDAVYRAIFERRDVRKDFLPNPIPEEKLHRILMASHHAGSVGFMQPWDFIVIRDPKTKKAVKRLFIQANNNAAQRYRGEKADLYRRMKLEGILEAPINLCVTCTRQRGGRNVLGRATIPETDLYSTCCAIQNLWLAARAEGIGIGWVSILDYEVLKRILGIPRPVKIVAYLCVGYVKEFSPQPDLEKEGWRTRLPLEQLVHYEQWGKGQS
jgi:5,6-dimethylbenzimidazole synthase